MLFTVTYRGRDGALREEAVEAADRAGCVAECRKRGIAPTRISEGGKGKGRDKRGSSRANGQDVRSPSQRARRPLSKWLVAALIVAVIAGGAWWWFGREGEPKATSVQQQGAKPKAEKPKAEKPVRPSARPEAVPVATNAPERVTAKGTRIPDNVKPDEFGVLRHPGGDAGRYERLNDEGIVTQRQFLVLVPHNGRSAVPHRNITHSRIAMVQ